MFVSESAELIVGGERISLDDLQILTGQYQTGELKNLDIGIDSGKTDIKIVIDTKKSLKKASLKFNVELVDIYSADSNEKYSKSLDKDGNKVTIDRASLASKYLVQSAGSNTVYAGGNGQELAKFSLKADRSNISIEELYAT
jgi:hypothetical protein